MRHALLVVAFALAPVSLPAAAAQAHAPRAPAISHARLEEATKLVSLWMPMAPATAKSVARDRNLNPLAAMFVRDLDPSNPRWNPSNPRWPAMMKRVRSDLRRSPHALEALAKIQDSTHEIVVRSVAKNLSDKNVQSLMQYFGTKQGKRYVDFQRKVTVIFGKGMGEALQYREAGKPFPTRGKTTQKTLERRVHLLSLSYAVQALRARFAADPQSPPDASATSGVGLMLAIVAEFKGPELDRLSRRYSHELGAFAKFNRSEIAKTWFAALNAAQSAIGKQVAWRMKGWMGNVEQTHQKRWREAYRAK